MGSPEAGNKNWEPYAGQRTKMGSPAAGTNDKRVRSSAPGNKNWEPCSGHDTKWGALLRCWAAPDKNGKPCSGQNKNNGEPCCAGQQKWGAIQRARQKWGAALQRATKIGSLAPGRRRPALPRARSHGGSERAHHRALERQHRGRQPVKVHAVRVSLNWGECWFIARVVGSPAPGNKMGGPVR